MSNYGIKRFPKRALKRYAELILRYVYQSGGRDRYVPVAEIEHELGLEPDIILQLCSVRLPGEIQIAYRPPVELEEHSAFQSPLEREWIREHFSTPHVRIRPEVVRLAADELVPDSKRRKSRA